MEEGQESGEDIMKLHYDEYDLNNVQDAKDFVYNSVDDELKKQLLENCTKDCSFVTYWLELMHVLKSVSLERFEALKTLMKKRKLTDYPGQNVEKLATDYLRDYKELDAAGV